VVDTQTEYILFANSSAQRDFGLECGLLCNSVMETGFPENCEKCNKNDIFNISNGKIQTTVYNNRLKRRFRKTDSIIEWKDTKKAMLSVLVDISEITENQEEIKKLLAFRTKLINSLPNIIWHIKTDSSDKILESYISETVNRLLGIEPETVGNNFENYFKYIHPADLQLVKENLTNAAFQESNHGIEYRLICKNDKIVWVYSHTSVYRESENCFEIFGSVSDISEIKNKETELAESENRYLGLFNNLPIPTIIHRNGTVFDINRAALDFVGAKDSKEIIGKNVMQFVHPDYIELSKQRIKKMLSENVALESVTEKYITLNGEVKDVETVAVPFTYQGEIFIQVVFADISNRKKDEELIRENQKKLTELNATKDKFFSLIAHDLKNPFHQIMGFTELLTDNSIPYDKEQSQNILQYIGAAAASAYKLLENLLQWSRSQTGRIDFRPENISVFDVLMSIIDMNQTAFKRKEILISQNIDPDLTVYADREMIETIVRNLISNAVKFSHRKGKIIISSYSKDRDVIISIQDFGIGMTGEQIDKLYKIDQTQSTAGTEDEPGTGLGLILCKEFILRNHGRIWVESELNKGCVFYLQLSSEAGF
jgi:PAS domain S-box-containing protein